MEREIAEVRKKRSDGLILFEVARVTNVGNLSSGKGPSVICCWDEIQSIAEVVVGSPSKTKWS